MLGWVNGFVGAGSRVTVVTPAADPRDPYYQPDERYEGPATVLTPRVFDPARLARSATAPTVDGGAPASEGRGLAARLRPLLLLPDQRRLANRPLARSATAALSSGNLPAVLLTSSPYNSVHLVGRDLKREFGDRITWVADFRDDWFHPVFFPFPNAAYRAYNRRLEGAVLREADGLSVVSRSTLAKVRGRHRAFPESFWETEGAGKWRWAPNGFDATGVEAILDEPVPPRSREAPIRLVFSGTLWQGHPLDALVAALANVARRAGAKFRFELSGRVIQELPPTPDPALVEIVTGGWKPYERALAETRQADLLLVHTGPETQDVKIKVFDAAAARRPVLVLGPEDSATVRLVREHVADPLVAGPGDEAGIAAALERYLATADESRHAFAGVPEEYDRLAQARRLLDWAKELTTESQRTRGK